MQSSVPSTEAPDTASSSSFETDVAIVGGGMVGVTAALLLAKKLPQLRISLLEQFPLSPTKTLSQPSFDQRATAISAGSFEVLGCLHLAQQLACVSGKIEEVHVSDKGHWGHATIRAQEHGLPEVGLVVPNAALGACLLKLLSVEPSIQCIAPIAVKELQPVQGGYQVHTSDGSLRARLVVLADGTNSELKRQLGIAAHRTDYQQIAAIANIQVEDAHRGRAFERFTADGPMALLPLADSHSMAMVWTLSQRNEAFATLPDAAFLKAAQACFGDRLGSFCAVGKRDVYPLALIESREQVRSHLALLGNAVHFLHPVAGQGFNLSVRDVVALVAAIERNISSVGVEGLGQLNFLQDYESERAMDQWLTVQYSHQLVDWFSHRDWHKLLPRQLGLLALGALPPLGRLLAEQSMGRLHHERT